LPTLADRTCKDINECKVNNGNCDQLCVNKPGGFECRCHKGYKLGFGVPKKPEPRKYIPREKVPPKPQVKPRIPREKVPPKPKIPREALYDENSAREKRENDPMVPPWLGLKARPLIARPLIARPLIYYPPLPPPPEPKRPMCVDVNECLVRNGGCNQICINLVGAWRCACKRGYRLARDGFTCVDINECRIRNGGCAHDCINLPGAFECKCRRGFRLAPDGFGCIDINECLIKNGGCGQICENLPGAYECKCKSGFKLLPDGFNCKATCKARADVGFILDSSGSLTHHYSQEKQFLNSIATLFHISEKGTRASVITFSHQAELSVKFNDFFDDRKFTSRVMGIPLMASVTRIDRALKLAQKEMFTVANGMRKNLPNILFLITDGSQTYPPDDE